MRNLRKNERILQEARLERDYVKEARNERENDY
jgi:hypothetical protein